MKNSLQQFNERQLVKRLNRLPDALRAAFAAACAQRLLAGVATLLQGATDIQLRELQEVLDRAWRVLEGGATNKATLPADLTRCMAIIEADDIAAPATFKPYADDAIAALAYALRAAVGAESQDAAWSARRAYEAADQFVIRLLDIDLNLPNSETEILGHHIVQRELKLQARDLEDLAAPGRGPEQVAQSIRRLALQAQSDGKRFFVEEE
jgi:hypothetical protein